MADQLSLIMHLSALAGRVCYSLIAPQGPGGGGHWYMTKTGAGWSDRTSAGVIRGSS